MQRILVTGASSFTARYLLPELAARYPGATLIASGHRAMCTPGLRTMVGDVTDRATVAAIVGAASPDLVIHLAGVRTADTDTCFAVNLDGTRNLLEACARQSSPPHLLLVSSAAVYGKVAPGESPVTEHMALRPVDAYGASKAAAEVVALSMHQRGLVPVTVVRPFNLIGPGLPGGLVAADFVQQVVPQPAGDAAEMRVGNLTPRRDFLDVRDAVRAYLDVASLPDSAGATYNVASGVALSIKELLDTVLRVAQVEMRIVRDPARLRHELVPEMIGNVSALRNATGWSTRIRLAESIADMLMAAGAAYRDRPPRAGVRQR